MIVTKTKTVLYFVQMTQEQKGNLINALVALTDKHENKAELLIEELESGNDVRGSILNA